VNAQPRRTAPVGLLVSAIAGLRQSVAAIVALTYVGRDMGPILWVGLGVAVLILSINVFFAGLSWHRLTFHVGAEDIRVESGILSRAARSVPYERIQDVSLEQGLLARLFGLVVVRFETGAGGADDITLSYLTEAEGEELRNLVRRRCAREIRGAVRDGPAPDPDVRRVRIFARGGGGDLRRHPAIRFPPAVRSVGPR
jgi:putative membrane protein